MIKNFFANPLIAGSSVFFVGTMVANFGNYLYHLLMGRMLGPKDYGTLTSLISLAYLLSIFSSTLLTTIIKFVTRYKAKRQFGKIYNLFWQLKKWFLFLGIFILTLFFLFREKITEFLNIGDSFLVILVGLWMILGFLAFVNEGILRGFLKFNFLSFNTVFSTFLKLILAVVFVKLGFSVVGALGAILLASLLSYLISFLPLRFLWQYKNGKEEINWKEFFSYSAPVLLATLGLTSLYSSDVILVKHLFPAYEAGLYASLAVLGKIVFFASGVVPAVMFPLVSERFENGKNYRSFFKQSFLIVGGVSLSMTALYYSLPKLMINLLYGPLYLTAAPLLGIFAVFIALYSECNLLINFFLSVGKTRLVVLPVLAALSQVILISFFHQSLFQVIVVSVGVCALLLGALLLFLRRNEKS